jgi:tetratricopeptide (TPR) repeat protein
MRIRASGWALAVLLTVTAAHGADVLGEVRSLRLSGDLDLAAARVAQAMQAEPLTPRLELDLRLELARIHDRRGLHEDSRPVRAALAEITRADGLAAKLGTAAAAAVALAFAEYYYRAEMAERDFTRATAEAEKALELFVATGDYHGQAEAVHRLGLIQLQRRELDRALALFDESLRLDERGGARVFFRGEYERHAGFVYWLRDEPADAVPYFRRSLKCRLQAGAIDASLFAAISLASALERTGDPEEARQHLLYALRIANEIGSAEGRARAQQILERLPEPPP